MTGLYTSVLKSLWRWWQQPVGAFWQAGDFSHVEVAFELVAAGRPVGVVTEVVVHAADDLSFFSLRRKAIPKWSSLVWRRNLVSRLP